MSPLYIGQLFTLQNRGTQVKLASAREGKKNQLAHISELSRNRYGFGVSGMAVSRHSVKAVEYLFSLSLSSLPCVGFTLRKSLPKQGQSTFRYTFISLAVPRKIEPFPEFPTNVLLCFTSLYKSYYWG